MTGGIHRVLSWAREQAMSECRVVNLTQREGRRGVRSLGGACRPAEPQKEMRVPRTDCVAAGRKARRAGHPVAWFEGSQGGSHSLTRQTSTRQQLGTTCNFKFSPQLPVPVPEMPLEPLSVGTSRRQWQPTPILLPGKSHGRRSLVGCSPWGR